MRISLIMWRNSTDTSVKSELLYGFRYFVFIGAKLCLLFVNTMSKNSYMFLPWADYCNGGHFWKTNHKLFDSELMKLASVSKFY